MEENWELPVLLGRWRMLGARQIAGRLTALLSSGSDVNLGAAGTVLADPGGVT